MKTFWLSFCDPERPEGEQFLGVAVVDVTDEQAAIAKAIIATKYPQALRDAEWLFAASRLAWEHGCNPGGEIASIEVTGQPEAAAVPRNRLLSKDEMQQFARLEENDHDERADDR